MSRIGKKPIPIPSGVECKLDGVVLRVKGPKGILQRNLHPNNVVYIPYDGGGEALAGLLSGEAQILSTGFRDRKSTRLNSSHT